MLKFIVYLFIFGTILCPAYAESGKFQTLDWVNPNEKLVYHSCGCADSCWVADLVNKKTNASKIQLSCDCEVMHLKVNGTETVFQGSCQEFEKEDKFQIIIDKMIEIQSER